LTAWMILVGALIMSARHLLKLIKLKWWETVPFVNSNFVLVAVKNFIHLKDVKLQKLAMKLKFRRKKNKILKMKHWIYFI